MLVDATFRSLLSAHADSGVLGELSLFLAVAAAIVLAAASGSSLCGCVVELLQLQWMLVLFLHIF